MNKDVLGGLILVLSAIAAIVVANSPLHSYYNLLIDLPLVVKLGDFGIAKPLLLWINDGLMAVFFLQVGLELKHEFLEGSLSDRKSVLLPAFAAVGGMAIPGIVYASFNWQDPMALQGWAIPAATDIAFALGVLALLGSRVPPALKIFLASLAIFDDMGAIIIIAIFYTAKISWISLLIAGLSMVGLYGVNRAKVHSRIPYAILGIVMWHAMLKSGVHATLAGVLLAMFIPLKPREPGGVSLLKRVEHSIRPWVMFLILPVFAFVNSGIRLQGVGLESLLHPVSVGITAGLFIGKQLGVFSASWIAIKLGLAKLPEGSNWSSLYGVSVICGIGFTMSLFIGSLAFEATGVNHLFDERLGILAGSLLSGLLGYFVLRTSLKKEF